MKQVTAAIIIEDNKVLLTRRAPGEKLAGMWEFPGGKVESNESLQECVIRELKEELSLNVETDKIITRSVYNYDHGQFEIIAIRVTVIDGELQLSVHDKVTWVPFNELLSYDLLPADIPIAKAIIQNLILKS